jgi:SAM-dependent MidA family methyltransferase
LGFKLHDPLSSPGSADVTCDVDFAYIRRHCDADAVTYGPVSQCDFLFQVNFRKLSPVLKAKLCSWNLQSTT